MKRGVAVRNILQPCGDHPVNAITIKALPRLIEKLGEVVGLVPKRSLICVSDSP
jgi:hypothetical protein